MNDDNFADDMKKMIGNYGRFEVGISILNAINQSIILEHGRTAGSEDFNEIVSQYQNGDKDDAFIKMGFYFCMLGLKVKNNSDAEKMISVILKGASSGGKAHHGLDRQAFKNDYRAERGDSPENTSPRGTIIDGLVSDYIEAVKRSTMESWAKEADREDGFIRKGGRPKKGS